MRYIALLLVSFLLNGASAQPAPTNAARIRVGFLPATHDSLLFIAIKEHLFAPELDVQPIRYTSSPDILNDLRGEKIDLGIPGIAAPIQFIAGGSKFQIVGGAAKESAAVVVRSSLGAKFKNAKSLNQKLHLLNGIRIGSVKQSTGDALFRKAIRDAGLQTSIDLNDSYRDPKIVLNDLKGEKLDAAVLWSPHMSAAEKEGLKIVLWLGEVLPEHVCCRQVVRDEFLNRDSEAVTKYLEGLIRAQKFYSDEANKVRVIEAVKSFVVNPPEILEMELYGERRTKLSVDLNSKGIKSYVDAMCASDLLRPDAPQAVFRSVNELPMVKAYQRLGLSEVEAKQGVSEGFNSVKNKVK